jgi:RND family efflux transporter MFP subunit
MIRNRWFLAGTVVFLLAAPSAWLMARNPEADNSAVVARVKKGEFKVVVTTSGELRARKFVQVSGPANMQQAGVYQTKIASIIPEGTVVKEGDVVAELDRSGAAAKLNEVMLALQKAEAQHEQAMLDSTLNLSKAREEIRTMDLGLEEKRLAKEQAVYEAPTVKRQAEIDYEKAQRALEQAKKDYVTKTEQAKAKMREVGADFQRQQNQLKVVQELMQNFSIRAPAAGMVIYQKEWNGKKRTVGSQVSGWDPTVATLPDLTQMESMTYVNEIDIRKIAIGQPVEISLDSDPTKKFPGKVTAVANVGEQRPNADAKVFEVKVELTQPDTTLRPGMTTSNEIETHKIKDVLFVPLEAVSSDSGVPIVFKRDGGRVVKQEVLTGAMSDDEVVVVGGLEEDDRVLLVPPADRETVRLVRLPGTVARPPVAIPGDSAKATRLQGVPPNAPSTPSPPTSNRSKPPQR